MLQYGSACWNGQILANAGCCCSPFQKVSISPPKDDKDKGGPGFRIQRQQRTDSSQRPSRLSHRRLRLLPLLANCLRLRFTGSASVLVQEPPRWPRCWRRLRLSTRQAPPTRSTQPYRSIYISALSGDLHARSSPQFSSALTSVSSRKVVAPSFLKSCT
jgi:hypothetical protein